MKPSLRIAVADDEPDLREFYARLLPRLGHQVVAVCSTGAELLEQCQRLNPDLVITDIRMPDMDGIQAATMLYHRHPLPVILVTAYPDPQLLRRIEQDHVMGHLIKPIRLSDLALRIEEAMQRFARVQSTPAPSDPVRG